MSAPFNAPHDAALYRMICTEIEEKLRRAADTYIDHFPHVSTLPAEGLRYPAEENKIWTCSFFPGMMHLAYRRTGDAFFLKHSREYLASFQHRLDTRTGISHDLGFLYTLSSVALYKLTGDKRARDLALAAAGVLTGRYNEKGRYIQCWGEVGKGNPYVKIIVDTMLNLPLLFWAGEESGDPRYAEIARAHAFTASETLVRKDYSSFHSYLMDPVTGRAIEGRTHQGFHDDTTWARGQAWVVTGYALAYAYTKEPRFLEVSRKAAEVFIDNLPADNVPYWDFSFSDRVPDLRDTSAASIFTCGLLELACQIGGEEAERYRAVARTVVRSLYDHYFLHDPDRLGLLTDAIYHRVHGPTCVIWGDYFFYETLMRLLENGRYFW
ncbi:MAG: glucoronyl hydrolase [Subdoligranulum sp.]|nr:glucoronyl hydrolase [Subdoligranulum sp.]